MMMDLTGLNEFFRASPNEMLYLYSQFSFFFAFFFWGWAGYNTLLMTRGMDLGIFSFAGVLLTSSYFLVKKGKNPTKCARSCSLFSHLLVSANYALGILYAVNIGPKPLYRFGTYCAIFTILWLALAMYSWRLITGVMIQELLEADETAHLYSFHDNREHARNYGHVK